jgi:hypothetical protein
MKGIQLIKNNILMVFLLTITTLSYAGTPVWTFTPLTATSISVPGNSTATIQYQVTNQSAKSHSLVMTPITGITQTTTGAGICSNPFTLPSKGSSCTLSLQVNGSQLTHSITDGPIVCEQGSTLQCYKPSPSNVLNINIGLNEYTIGGTVSGLSGSVVLQNNGTDNETVSSDGAFTFSTVLSEGSHYAVTVFTQPAGQTCAVTGGSGTVGSANVTTVAVNCVSNDTTLTESVATLGLSVNDPGLNVALTGAPRVITIYNSGTTTANNVACPTSGSASITSIVCTGCGTILAGQSCQVTITPSGTPSATAYDTNPTPITLSISGTNTNTLTPTINILTYGSVYQGGFVYEITDTTPYTGRIGGTVASLVDQAEPYINSGPQTTNIIWSSNGAASNVSYDYLPGIDETSSSNNGSPTYTAFSNYFQSTYTNTVAPLSSSFNECNGSTDGSCDTSNILAFYNTWVTNDSPSCDQSQGGSGLCTATPGPTTLTYYAAGLCTATINGYSDWYLPAICEMDAVNTNLTCPAGTQSMLGSLTALIGDPGVTTPSTSCNPPAGTNCLAGYYWSSTEVSGFQQDYAWVEYFASGGGSSQLVYGKNNSLGARCSRALTP